MKYKALMFTMQLFAAIAFGFILMAMAYIGTGMTDAAFAFKAGFTVSGCLFVLNLIGGWVKGLRLRSPVYRERK
jgi:hypothetical protein